MKPALRVDEFVVMKRVASHDPYLVIEEMKYTFRLV